MEKEYLFSNFNEEELYGRWDGQEADDDSSNQDTVDDVINLLGEDDKDDDKVKDEVKDSKKNDKKLLEEDKDGNDEEDKEDDEDDEDEKIELEDEDEEEEKLEDEKIEVVVHPRKKEILKAYPDLFKKFPSLEASLYRDRQFTEIFATPKDAESAAESVRILNNFEADLDKGDISKVLEAVKKNDPKAFDKVVDNYLIALHKVDSDAYLEIAGNIIRGLIGKMSKDPDDDVKLAAKLANKFAFNTEEQGTFTRRTKPASEEDNTVKNEKAQYEKQRFDDSKADLTERLDNTLKNTILLNIDKKEEMTEYVKRNSSKDALASVKSLIEKDKSFEKILSNLWKKAQEERYSRPSLERIKGAYLSKAKSLLPQVISKARMEALKGLGKKREDKDRSGPVRRSSTSSNGGDKDRDDTKDKSNKSKGVPRGMSTLDWLNNTLK